MRAKVSNDGIPANLFRRYRAFTRGGAKIGGRFFGPKSRQKTSRLSLHQPSSVIAETATSLIRSGITNHVTFVAKASTPNYNRQTATQTYGCLY